MSAVLLIFITPEYAPYRAQGKRIYISPALQRGLGDLPIVSLLNLWLHSPIFCVATGWKPSVFLPKSATGANFFKCVCPASRLAFAIFVSFSNFLQPPCFGISGYTCPYSPFPNFYRKVLQLSIYSYFENCAAYFQQRTLHFLQRPEPVQGHLAVYQAVSLLLFWLFPTKAGLLHFDSI